MHQLSTLHLCLPPQLATSTGHLNWPPTFHQLSTNFPSTFHQLSTNFPPTLHLKGPPQPSNDYWQTIINLWSHFALTTNSSMNKTTMKCGYRLSCWVSLWKSPYTTTRSLSMVGGKWEICLTGDLRPRLNLKN